MNPPTTALFLNISLIAVLLLQATAPADEDPAFVDPPGEETAEVRALIDRAAESLKSSPDTDAILGDPAFMPAHAYPRFRELIRAHASGSSAALVTPDEPGDKLIVRGTIRDPRGGPLGDALVYVYQTSARGWYSDRAAHVRANAGDMRHARLFAYLRTDEQGRFELRTIRPGGYPRSTLPQHIHIHVTPAGTDREALVSEICFEDDPRLTPAVREQVRRSGFLICPVTRDADGVQHVRADFTLR